MRDLLQLPALWSTGPASPEPGAGPPLAERLRAAVDRLLASAAEDPAAALAAALGARGDAPLHAFAARATARPGGESACPQALYGCAAEAVAGGELAAASVGLAALLEDPATLPAALLGLAICALHADRPDEALAMALSSRQGEAGHPRAYAVAGVAEHLRGHASKARLYLALSARLARTAAEHAPDLRLAQRLLLAMQVG